MTGIKILHCADMHLDMPFTSLGNEGGRSSIRRQELKNTFKDIIKIAREQLVDILLICGDLYENDYIRRSTLAFLCDEFASIPQIQVFIVPGNHDPYFPGCCYRNINWPDNVHILAGEKPFHEIAEKNTLVYGSIPENNSIDNSKINILMLHATLDMNIGKNTFNPISSKVLDVTGMDYIALGHFHNRLVNKGGRRNIFNPGSPEPLGFDEEGSHGIFICEITQNNSGKSIDVRFIEMNKRFYRNIVIDVAGCQTDEQIIQKVEETIAAEGDFQDLFNISFKGATAPGFRINADIVEAALLPKAFFVRLKDESVPGYDFEKLAGELGLKGEFTRKMLERAANAANEEEKLIIMQALYYGMEAIEQGTLCL